MSAAIAVERLQCHVASADAAPLAADVRRQARRGALRAELTAGAASLAVTSASSLFIESAVR